MNRLQSETISILAALGLAAPSLLFPGSARGAGYRTSLDAVRPAPMVEIQIPAGVGTGIGEGETMADLAGGLEFHTQIQIKLWDGVQIGINRAPVLLHRGANRQVRRISIEAQPGGSVELLLPNGARWAMGGAQTDGFAFRDGLLTLSAREGAALLFDDGLRILAGRSQLEFHNNRPNDEHWIVVSPLAPEVSRRSAAPPAS